MRVVYITTSRAYCRTSKLKLFIFGLPQLDGIPFGVVQSSKATIGINLGIYNNRDSKLAKLINHTIQTFDSKIDHPNLLSLSEILSIARKRSEHRRTFKLLPWTFRIV